MSMKTQKCTKCAYSYNDKPPCSECAVGKCDLLPDVWEEMEKGATVTVRLENDGFVIIVEHNTNDQREDPEFYERGSHDNWCGGVRSIDDW